MFFVKKILFIITLLILQAHTIKKKLIIRSLKLFNFKQMAEEQQDFSH